MKRIKIRNAETRDAGQQRSKQHQKYLNIEEITTLILKELIAPLII